MRISDWSSDVCSSDLPRLDVAEGAGARAGVTEDHHRRMLFRPAFADVRAGRFLANRMQIELAHQLARFGITGASRRLDANPVGLPGARGAVGHGRSEGRRLGKEWVGPCRSRWWR